MEFAEKEVMAIRDLLTEKADEQIQVLDDLQLALVGGGQGDIILGR